MRLKIHSVEEVKRRVADLKAATGDPEEFHSLEQALHRAVLQAIAQEHPEPSRLAAEALKSLTINVKRWYG